MASFLSPLLREPDVTYQLENIRSGSVVADRVLTAFDSKARKKGLLGCDGLPAGSALIIAPSNAVHTWFMRFSIDIVFVARNGRVLKVRAAVRPWRVTGALRGFAVIELPAGTLERSQTLPGDTLSLSPVLRGTGHRLPD